MKSSTSFFKSILLLVLIMTLFAQCKKDTDEQKDPEKTVSEIVAEQNKRLEKVVKTATTTTFLHGNVLDENENPLSGVIVKVADKTKTTDSKGYFVFEEAVLNKEFAVVKAEKAGYMKGLRTFTPTVGAMNKIEFVLQKNGTAQSLDANKGGEFVFDNGKVKLNFPAASIADVDGKAYSGTVKVNARYIDPVSNGFASAMPGNLVGLTDANNLVGMISYGMANVELTDNSGNPLQILIGKTVKVIMPAIKDVPADMPVWHFNETYGLWVEAGKATKSGAEYSFEANHFSTWNLDTKVEDAVEKVNITLKSSTNLSISNQKVNIYTSDFVNLLRTVYTDDKGQFTLLYFPKSLGLRVVLECQNLDKTVNITSENVTVTLNNLIGSAKVYQIKGIIKDCKINYTNSFFILKDLSESKISLSGKTNTSGEFETNFILCDVNQSTKYQVEAMVFTGSSTVKIDTIELTFSSSSLIKDIDFCDAVEVENPYLNPELTYGNMIDIDGNKYATIQIGTQTWMAENLKTSRYNDGTVIPNVIDSLEWRNLTIGAWSYYNNDSSYNKYYGKLYNSISVFTGKLCPKGWHIPKKQDFTTLVNYLGGKKVAGAKLQSSLLWGTYVPELTNESGFSSIGGGERTRVSAFGSIDSIAQYYSNTSNYLLVIYSGGTEVILDDVFMTPSAHQCRCMKD